MRKSLCRPKASFDRAEKGLTVQPDKGKENPSASDASSSREQKSREKTYGEAILLARDRATEREMRALGALLARTDEPLVGMDGNEPGGARTKSIPRRGVALTRGLNRQAAPMRKNENRRAREEIQDQDTQRVRDLLQTEEKRCESEPENLFGEK
jgi:hypothetical protein